MANGNGNIGGGDPLTSHVLERYERWKLNRSELEERWERNWRHFNCEDDPNGKLWKSGEGEGWRSTTFMPITRQKVESGYALVIDMLLQGSTGDIPFELRPGPASGVDLREMPVVEARERVMGIDDMASLIRQQFADCDADRELMKNVKSGAIYGETWGKRYLKEAVRKRFEPVVEIVDAGNGPEQVVVGMQAVEVRVPSPAYKQVTVWDIFRDLEVDDIQAGEGIIHRQFLTSGQLDRLARGVEEFDQDAVGRVIASASEEGSSATATVGMESPVRRELSRVGATIEYLEYWGRVPVKAFMDYLATSGGQSPESLDENADDMEMLICVADGTLLRFSVMDEGDRPFFHAEWERNIDGLGGRGIADSLAEIQVALNGALRAFEDNKRLSGNVMLGVKKEYLIHPDKALMIAPGMQIPIASECSDVRSAIQPIVIPDVGGSLLEVLGTFERYADESSMIPKVSQGLNAKAQITAYEISQLVENAGKYIGSVIRNFDEGIIEPLVWSFLKWNMEDPDSGAPQQDITVRALGFTSYNNRIIRVQKLMQFLGLIGQTPGMEKEYDLSAIVAEIAKAMEMDLSLFRKTPEQMQQEAEAAANDMRAQLELAAAQAEVQHKVAQASKWSADAAKAESDARLGRAKFAQDVRRDIDAGLSSATRGEDVQA
jgi:hypothetical protein